MTLLDTFIFQFQTDAKAAKADLTAFEAQIVKTTESGNKLIAADENRNKQMKAHQRVIDDLTGKGKARTDAENKQLKEAQLQHKHLSDQMQDTQENGVRLGIAFKEIGEALAGATAAYITFGSIKAGIMDATAFNANLELTSKLTGQNTQDIATYGAAFERFGGSAAGFQSTLKSMTSTLAQQGQQMPAILPLFQRLNREMQGLSLNESARLAAQYGIHDEAMLNILRQTPEAYDALIARSQKYNQVSKDAAPVALAFNNAMQDTKDIFNTLFTEISTAILPAVTKFLNLFNEWVSGHHKQAEIALIAIATAIGLIGLAITGGAIAALTGLGATAIAITAPFIALAAAIGGVIAAAATLDKSKLSDHKTALGQWIWHQFHDPATPGSAGAANDNAQPGAANDNGAGIQGQNGAVTPKGVYPAEKGQSSMAFWMKQGYTPAQAAGWAANEMRESAGNAAVHHMDTDGKMHYGLYQWSPDRRASIMKGTGIDVATANAEQQREAAAWEAHSRGDDERVKATSTAGDSAAVINRHYEVSRDNPQNRMQLAEKIQQDNQDPTNQMMAAGKVQLDAAASAPINNADNSNTNNNTSKNITVKTGDIHVNTQATDADGIANMFSDSLQKHISATLANYDDGVAV